MVEKMPPKIGLYSISKVLELILQHLMINSLYSESNINLDPILKSQIADT
jgi:hypothetical protein